MVDFELFGSLRGDDDEQEQSGEKPSPGLGGREEQQSSLGGSGLSNQVENMFEQGYSEDEIRNELSGQYSDQEVDTAINRAVTDNATPQDDGPQPMTSFSSQPQEPGPENQAAEPSSQDMNSTGPQGPPPQDTGNQAPPPQPREPQSQAQQQEDARVEEIVETVVAEEFSKVRAEFKTVYGEINKIEEMLDDFGERIEELEVRDDEDSKQFIQKMDELEEQVQAYDSRMGGMEKAFQQVLPNLVDNVQNLTSLVQEMKEKNGVSTQTDVDSEEINDLEGFDNFSD